jgi:hypothetical protein
MACDDPRTCLGRAHHCLTLPDRFPSVARSAPKPCPIGARRCLTLPDRFPSVARSAPKPCPIGVHDVAYACLVLPHYDSSFSLISVPVTLVFAQNAILRGVVSLNSHEAIRAPPTRPSPVGPPPPAGLPRPPPLDRNVSRSECL